MTTSENIDMFTLVQCDGTQIFVQNTGVNTLNSNVAFYEVGSQKLAGYIGFEEVSVLSGNSNYVPIVGNSSEISGNYQVLHAGVQQIQFSC